VLENAQDAKFGKKGGKRLPVFEARPLRGKDALAQGGEPPST